MFKVLQFLQKTELFLMVFNPSVLVGCLLKNTLFVLNERLVVEGQDGAVKKEKYGIPLINRKQDIGFSFAGVISGDTKWRYWFFNLGFLNIYKYLMALCNYMMFTRVLRNCQFSKVDSTIERLHNKKKSFRRSCLTFFL